MSRYSPVEIEGLPHDVSVPQMLIPSASQSVLMSRPTTAGSGFRLSSGLMADPQATSPPIPGCTAPLMLTRPSTSQSWRPSTAQSWRPSTSGYSTSSALRPTSSQSIRSASTPFEGKVVTPADPSLSRSAFYGQVFTDVREPGDALVDIETFDVRLGTLASSPPRPRTAPAGSVLKSRRPVGPTTWRRQPKLSSDATATAVRATSVAKAAAAAKPAPSCKTTFVPTRHGLRSWIPLVEDPYCFGQAVPAALSPSPTPRFEGLCRTGSPEAREAFLQDQWRPFYSELLDALCTTRTRHLLGVSTADVLPKQDEWKRWTASCMQLTAEWHGRPNVAAVYRALAPL